MTDRELMQMALDALESSRVFVTSREQIKHPEGTEWYDERIEALRARLTQPKPAECDGGQCGIGGYCKECPKTQQEPTARDINEVILNSIHDSSEVVAQPQREWCQCKDAPNDCTYEKNCRVPQIDAAFKRIEWQGLTDEEITETLKRFGLGERAALARAIEAKLREKNAPDL